MKPGKTKTGFTIIELLTVMSIIIILISVLVPALNKVRIFAKRVTQNGQFHEISKGLEMFRNDNRDTLPDSGPTGLSSTGGAAVGYCGAMKLCEAMLGQDGMGYHPSSRFFADGIAFVNNEPCDLYPFDLCFQINPAPYTTNLREREKYVARERFRAARLQDLYDWGVDTGLSYRDGVGFQSDPSLYPNAVICDVFQRGFSRCPDPNRIGEKLGMPVLYYKADPSKLSHDVGNPLNVDNMYNFDDNYAVTALGCSWETGAVPLTPHPMYQDLTLFYKAITNTDVTATPRPHNEDGYILLSAGWDGLYGTNDDVFNFSD